MGIGSMIKREDFYKILQETILVYFLMVRHQKIECKYERFDGGEEFRIFVIGNIVCREKKPKCARKFLKAEYNIRNSLWKYIAGKLLVHYMMFTRKVFSPKGIFLTKGALGKREFISPQNRSIRFYDYDNNHVDCIVKQGFTDKYFNNQIEFRKKYRYDFMVPLIDSGNGWFREPILYGHPLARVTGKHKYQRGIDTVINHIQALAQDTLKYQQLGEYSLQLLDKAKQLTIQAKLDKEISTYKKCIELLTLIEKDLKNKYMEVPTCISHGDLQTGNIWMNKDGKVLIYDWETAGRRSIWYDSATLLYSLRRPNGWNEFINDERPILSLACDTFKNRTIEEFSIIKKIVLLEDYLFLIEDMMELPQDWGNDIFDGNINRIHQVVFGD